MDFVIELLGWYSSVALLAAYHFNSSGRLSAKSVSYQVLNLTAGIGFSFLTIRHGVYQAAVVNIVWSIIAIIALRNILLLSKQKPS